MCNYEQVIEQDVKETLANNYGYGKASIDKFWKLNGEAICEEAYKAITEVLVEETDNYEKIIGDTEL